MIHYEFICIYPKRRVKYEHLIPIKLQVISEIPIFSLLLPHKFLLSFIMKSSLALRRVIAEGPATGYLTVLSGQKSGQKRPFVWQEELLVCPVSPALLCANVHWAAPAQTSLLRSSPLLCLSRQQAKDERGRHQKLEGNEPAGLCDWQCSLASPLDLAARQTSAP